MSRPANRTGPAAAAMLPLLLLLLSGCVTGRFGAERAAERSAAARGAAATAARAETPDPCQPQFAGFETTGQVFMRDAGFLPAWPALAGGDALARLLTRENAELDRLQVAFDGLLYCRWIEARAVRADFAAGRLARPEAEARMAAARARVGRDLGRARQVRDRLAARGERLESAAEAAAPGIRATAARAREARGAATPAVAAATVTLRLRPEAAAPEVGRVPLGQTVSLRPAPGGFVFVDAGTRSPQGYAQAAAFQVTARPPSAADAAEEAGGDGAQGALRRLAASNIARRENFAESLALAEGSATTGGFELAL